MGDRIPTSMRAIVLREYRAAAADAIAGLTVAERPVARPAHGQVLVRMDAAPCNPSDLLLLQGKYGSLKTLPTVPGWEGTGTVVASGGGLLAKWLRGKRVSCALRGDRDGTWAEYFVADARDCIALKQQMTVDQAASLIVNPFTAVGLLETARRSHRAAIQTAAASQLGRIVLTLAKDAGYPLINIVRREKQVKLLQSLGAEHVLNSADDRFEENLKHLAEGLKATVAFEAIAGSMTGALLNAMPRGSAVYLYGALSEEACAAIDPVELIFREKELHGFYLGTWLKRRSVLKTLRDARYLQNLLIEGRIATQVQRRVTLEEVVDGLQRYVQNMTAGKVLFMPHSQS